MMKSQLWLKVAVNGQLHALFNCAFRRRDPSTHWTENKVFPKAILLMAMMRKIWTTLLAFEYHSRSS